MKIGFACKYHGPKHETDRYNFKTTTLQCLNRLTTEEARVKVHRLAIGNLERLENLVDYVGQLPPVLRMLRISTCDLFPFFCSSDHSVRLYGAGVPVSFRDDLRRIGEKCRNLNIRISSHPGQFVFLATRNSDHLTRSLFELEMTTGIFLAMGYYGWHPYGLCVNIHYGNSNVPYSAWQRNFQRLSTPAQQFLTIENAEYDRYDLHELHDRIGENVAIVMDLHHYWIHTRGYLLHTDLTVNRVIDSWRGVRPKLHCSMSQPELELPASGGMLPLTNSGLPSYQSLVDSGLNSRLLRKHCDLPWSDPLAEYYSRFADRFDIMVEMKHKQVAAQALLHKFTLPRGGAANASS